MPVLYSSLDVRVLFSVMIYFFSGVLAVCNLSRNIWLVWISVVFCTFTLVFPKFTLMVVSKSLKPVSVCEMTSYIFISFIHFILNDLIHVHCFC